MKRLVVIFAMMVGVLPTAGFGAEANARAVLVSPKVSYNTARVASWVSYVNHWRALSAEGALASVRANIEKKAALRASLQEKGNDAAARVVQAEIDGLQKELEVAASKVGKLYKYALCTRPLEEVNRGLNPPLGIAWRVGLDVGQAAAYHDPMLLSGRYIFLRKLLMLLRFMTFSFGGRLVVAVDEQANPVPAYVARSVSRAALAWEQFLRLIDMILALKGAPVSKAALATYVARLLYIGLELSHLKRGLASVRSSGIIQAVTGLLRALTSGNYQDAVDLGSERAYGVKKHLQAQVEDAENRVITGDAVCAGCHAELKTKPLIVVPSCGNEEHAWCSSCAYGENRDGQLYRSAECAICRAGKRDTNGQIREGAQVVIPQVPRNAVTRGWRRFTGADLDERGDEILTGKQVPGQSVPLVTKYANSALAEGARLVSIDNASGAAKGSGREVRPATSPEAMSRQRALHANNLMLAAIASRLESYSRLPDYAKECDEWRTQRKLIQNACVTLTAAGASCPCATCSPRQPAD